MDLYPQNPLAEGPIPAQAGVGLKAEYYPHALENTREAAWFEVHPENYMGAGGPPHRYLTAIRELYPVSLHGVGLSIGGAQPLNTEHLNRLKLLIDRYQPALFSEHLAWSTHDTHFLNDLLPVPYTAQTLAAVVAHVDQTQSHLKRQMLLENPSTYVQFETSTMDEVEFIAQIAQKTGCGLLLDVNNIFVSAQNHNYCPYEYISRFPTQFVQEIHLAGHNVQQDDAGAPLLIDSHDALVADPVWALYDHLIAKIGATPTLIEWDSNLPTWAVLVGEAAHANSILARHARAHAAE